MCYDIYVRLHHDYQSFNFGIDVSDFNTWATHMIYETQYMNNNTYAE